MTKKYEVNYIDVIKTVLCCCGHVIYLKPNINNCIYKLRLNENFHLQLILLKMFINVPSMLMKNICMYAVNLWNTCNKKLMCFFNFTAKP